MRLDTVAYPVIFRLLVAMVLIAPLPFGAFPAWAWASMAGCTGALLLGWGILAAAGHVPVVRPPHRLWWCAAPFALAMFWAVFQTVPFSPAAWHHPLWRSAAEALGTSRTGSISLDPAASRESIVRIASYAGIFWLAFQCCRDRERSRSVLTAVAMGCAGYALYGLVVKFSGTDTILWFEKTAYHDLVTGTFVNRNSFATFAGLGLLCATAALREGLKRVCEGASGPRERLRRLLVEEPHRNGTLLGAWFVLAVALLLTESRAGTAASVLALLVFFSTLAMRRGVSARSLILPAAGLTLAAATLVDLSGEGLEQRLWTTRTDWETRSEIYEQTGKAIRDAPVFGTGLGTFETVYRVYRTGRIGATVARAHNDYLEIALELGIPAAVCFLGALAGLALVCAAGIFARRRDAVLPATGFAACVLAGAHALVDFSLQIPAVAATFALVLGAAAAQSWRSGGG